MLTVLNLFLTMELFGSAYDLYGQECLSVWSWNGGLQGIYHER